MEESAGMSHSKASAITPRLVVHDAAAAITMYERVLGARCLEKYEGPDGKIVHAALSVRDAVFSLTDEDERYNKGPRAFGGSPLLLTLSVEDPDAIAQAMIDEGGRALIPVDDRDYGFREGRIEDAFGHLWIVSKPLQADQT